MLPTIISFYTSNWLYSQHAERLRAECDALGLDHLIEERPDVGDYLANCRQKPFFILECLNRLNRPVLWLDVDGSLRKRPAIFEGMTADFAAHPKGPGSERKWHVCVMYFTPAAKWFVQGWIDSLKDWSDELALQQYWETGPQINHVELPDDYFHEMHRFGEMPPSTVYAFGLSHSEQKKEFQAKVRRGEL